MGESANENVYNNNKSKSYDIFFFLFLVKEIKIFIFFKRSILQSASNVFHNGYAKFQHK